MCDPPGIIRVAPGSNDPDPLKISKFGESPVSLFAHRGTVNGPCGTSNMTNDPVTDRTPLKKPVK